MSTKAAAGEHPSYGLRPRPEPPPDVLAAIVAAVEEAWPRPSAASRDAAHRAWRFSGRWWARPTAARRERPWTPV
ncbi:MAG TPA: hypothetical protein VK277_07315 [Acidimicrobiales bacterium]|nr:hypothetical protein [Acidimicrobiales bacterium]